MYHLHFSVLSKVKLSEKLLFTRETNGRFKNKNDQCPVPVMSMYESEIKNKTKTKLIYSYKKAKCVKYFAIYITTNI